MLFERQRVLLTLLDAIGAPVGNTDFQKLLFLYTRECEKAPSYEFVPYRFGGFSFTSYADKRRMIEAGLLADDETMWRLTPLGIRTARQRAVNPLGAMQFCRRYARLRGNDLIAHQYRRYPYYATRSEILDKVLTDPEARLRVEQARPPKAGTGLVTVGYERKSLERYLNQLLQAGVTLLCDVRRNSLSRKYGFSKKTLMVATDGIGIRYEHLPELGIDTEDRRALDTQADYDALFAEYKTRLPLQATALNKILSWMDQGHRVALTCYELDPRQCHRSYVAMALVEQPGRAFRPLHI